MRWKPERNGGADPMTGRPVPERTPVTVPYDSTVAGLVPAA